MNRNLFLTPSFYTERMDIELTPAQRLEINVATVDRFNEAARRESRMRERDFNSRPNCPVNVRGKVFGRRIAR